MSAIVGRSPGGGARNRETCRHTQTPHRARRAGCCRNGRFPWMDQATASAVVAEAAAVSLSEAEMVRTDLAVATTPATPEAATHAVGKATAHAMADIVPEFMVLAAVASVIRRIP